MTRRWGAVGLAWLALASIVFAENLFGRQLEALFLLLPGIDKVLHFIEYFALFAIVHQLASRRTSPVRARAIGLLAVGSLALLDEWIQRWGPGRSVEGADLLADYCGILAGFALAFPVAWVRVGVTAAAALAGTAVSYDSYARTHDYSRGIRYERQRDYKQARAAYALALEAGMRTPGLYNSLSWVEIESTEGDAGRAIAYAEQALAMRPDDPDILDTYGWALFHGGRREEALAALNRAYASGPRIYCINYHLGVVLRSLKRDGEAADYFERQVEGWPGSVEARRASRELATMREIG